jgi:uncharacterized protein (TIGR02271 family)
MAAIATLAAGCCGTTHTTKTAQYQRYDTMPAYTGGTETETTTTTTTQPATAVTTSGTTNMVVPLYQEQVNVGKREVESGSVRLKKIVRTETVNVPVELRREEVVIDRDTTAKAQGQAVGQPFQEQEMVVPLKREEAVVEKQTASAGQIVVQTRYSGERTNIQAQVRKEDIDIAKQGDAQNVIIGQGVHAAGAAESPGGQSYAGGSTTVITDPTMISTTADPATLNGRPVRFENCKVRKVAGDRLLIIGTDTQEVYVVPAQGTTLPKEGDTVVITGTVKKSPASASELGLTGDSAQTFGSQPIYVDARTIEVSR